MLCKQWCNTLDSPLVITIISNMCQFSIDSIYLQSQSMQNTTAPNSTINHKKGRKNPLTTPWFWRATQMSHKSSFQSSSLVLWRLRVVIKRFYCHLTKIYLMHHFQNTSPVGESHKMTVYRSSNAGVAKGPARLRL